MKHGLNIPFVTITNTLGKFMYRIPKLISKNEKIQLLEMSSNDINSSQIKRSSQKKPTNIRNLYEFKQVLGTGAFSEVVLAHDKKSETPVAIKCIKRRALKGKEETLQNEISVLRQ